MSTRSAILMKTETGFKGIYCHFDGYLDGVGRTLLAHYTDPAKVTALLALGDISVLGERVDPINPSHSWNSREEGTTLAFKRDRGEDGVDAIDGATVEEVCDKIQHNGYVYLFAHDKWTCNGEDLAEAIRKEAL